MPAIGHATARLAAVLAAALVLPLQLLAAPPRPAPLDCADAEGVSAADVQKAQSAWAAFLGRPVEEDDEIAPGVKMKFVLVPPGKFLMGSPAEEQTKSRVADEGQHEVEITRPFYLGKYEVTQAQYDALVGKNKNRSAFRGPELPVETVNWDEATAYAAAWTTKRGDGLKYRLPTEAEWEYACRAGHPSSQPFGTGNYGSSLSSKQANFDGQYPYGGAAKGKFLAKTTPAGQYPPNALGLHDMHGNVWEWCADWYGDYPPGKVTDPSGPPEGSSRVVRGGCWDSSARYCRAAYRDGHGPRYWSNSLGFRLARVLPGPDKTPSGPPTPAPGEPPVPPQNQKGKPPRTVLVIHGGAGVLTEEEMKKEGLRREDFEQALARALRAGYKAMRPKGSSSVDGVEAAIRVMEDSELFNAGRGAAFNSDGRVELDAAIMEGNMDDGKKGEGKNDPRKRAGAVAAVTNIKNPISAARAVMEMPDSRHVLLVGPGAELFALGEPVRSRYRIERVSNLYFWTDRRLRQIREEFKKEASRPGKPAPPEPSKDSRRGPAGGADRRFGTVGAVALDRHNHLAAGTSTGGLTNKMPGRVGDSPVIGAGTYADDRACGVSCTGTGEVFIRHAVAHDVVARMHYAGKSVGGAVQDAIDQLPDEEGGVGGLIALDTEGRHTFGMSKKSDGMYRGYVTAQGKIYVAIFKEELKPVKAAERDGAKAKGQK
jgi:beta-aspartyl-peptidase (threonine type)